MSDETPVRVAIGLIEREGRYLIRQRPPGSIMAGVWEFPGGKCEPGETEPETVVRECLEETGLAVVPLGVRSSRVHRYPHGLIALTYFDCRPEQPDRDPEPSTGFVWVPAEDLGGYRFPDANEAVVEQLSRQGRNGRDTLAEG